MMPRATRDINTPLLKTRLDEVRTSCTEWEKPKKAGKETISWKNFEVQRICYLLNVEHNRVARWIRFNSELATLGKSTMTDKVSYSETFAHIHTFQFANLPARTLHLGSNPVGILVLRLKFQGPAASFFFDKHGEEEPITYSYFMEMDRKHCEVRKQTGEALS
ncbi:unnamed protein product [Victoria cruziana]